MSNNKEAFSRVLIDRLLETSGWDLTDSKQVKYETSGASRRADYLLMGQYGPHCFIEAKKPSLDPCEAWRLRRAIQAEATITQTGLSKEYCHKTMDQFFDGSGSRKLNNITRYEAMPAKHFYRTLSELRAMQSGRKQETADQDPGNIPKNGFVSKKAFLTPNIVLILHRT